MRASVFGTGVNSARMMAFGPAGDLFVAGTRADVVYRLPDRDSDGVADGVERWATGLALPHGLAARDDHLRNAVGLTRHPTTGEVWATNNGRDWLGDDMPADGVYRLRDGLDAGWPRCNPTPSGALVPDPDFGRPGSCDGVAARRRRRRALRLRRPERTIYRLTPP